MPNIIDIRKKRKDFVEGSLKAIELFKIVFDINKNVIINYQQKNHINNTELLLEKQNFKNKEFMFGFNFVLENISEFRKNLCTNPIFYLLFLEYIIKNLSDLNKIQKETQSMIDFVLFYYQNSFFAQVKPTFQEVCFIQDKYLKNNFLEEVAKISYDLVHVTIQESKENFIEKDPYYSLKCSHFNYKDAEKDCECIIWFSKITKIELDYFINFVLINKKRVVVFYNGAEKEVEQKIKSYVKYGDNLFFVKIPGLTFYDKMKDVQIISGAQINYYDAQFQQIETYQFGKIKTILFLPGLIKIKGIKKYEEIKKQLTYLFNSQKIERLLTLQGKSYIIYAKEENLEEVRALVSSCRSMYNYGVFYNELTTLSLLNYYFKLEKKETKTFEIIMLDYLKLLENEENAVEDKEKILNNQDLKKTYNIQTKTFEENKMFIPFENYSYSFKLLKSNINVLKNIL